MEFNINEINGSYIIGDNSEKYGNGIKGEYTNAESEIFIPSYIRGFHITIIGVSYSYVPTAKSLLTFESYE